jgi:hypothetical protein
MQRISAPNFRTVVDYGPKSSFSWTTIESDGAYEVNVSARNNTTGELAEDTVTFQFSSLAQNGPAVTPTGHPLVFIYSAPPCSAGSRISVQFVASDGSGAAIQTPARDCDGRSTVNFYLSAMRASTAYTAWQTIRTATAALDGPRVPFTSGAPTVQPLSSQPISTPLPAYGDVLLQSVVSGVSVATDLSGNLLWYSPSGLSLITRISAAGTFLGLFEDGTKDPSQQRLVEFDMAGVTMAETNASRVSEQLTALGARAITSFHHEAIRLPDDRYLVMAGTEQVMDGVQGDGEADILGDMILVLDSNLQVEWYWDAFDHLDPYRMAILNETCAYPATLACSPFYGAGTANDWLHGNSLQLTPDGNILYSIRHQDWIVKIDYRNGAGSGDILWRLGLGGDFTLTSGNPNDWFSHQHDPQFLQDGKTLLVFDNGNTRIQNNGGQGTSRAQVWRIDENASTATLLLNADLKVNSAALGSVQLLANGNYHFDAGFITSPSNPNARTTEALEVDPGGNIVWGMQINAQQYRSFRLNDLYTPPVP